MRILFLYMFPFWGNGSGSFIRELSLQLVKKGHEVAIVAPDERKLPYIKHYVVPKTAHGVFVGHPEWPKIGKFADMSAEELGSIHNQYLTTSLHAVSDFRPDLIHVFHTPFLPGIARIIKSLTGIRYIITTHGSDLSYLATDRRFMGMMADANLHTRFITANSDFTKRWYITLFGSAIAKKVKVVMGGVNMEHFKRDPKLIDQINEQFGLKHKKVVLFTGRLTSHKGVIYLIRAAQSIKGTVVIVGDGPEREMLEKEIAKRKLTNVIMAGYMNTTNNPLYHAMYERADVYVSPSVWDEPLGLTILEAMAGHTPVVATRKGGVVSIIEEEKNGFLVRARNSTEIAEAVNRLLSDDKLRKKIGLAAYNTVKEKFSWDKIADRFEKMYQEIKKTGNGHAGPLDDWVQWVFFGKKMRKKKRK